VDRTKAIWRLINREICKAPQQKLELKIENKIISNPTVIIDKLNTLYKHCGRTGKGKSVIEVFII
jgi:hypothetical protein